MEVTSSTNNVSNASVTIEESGQTQGSANPATSLPGLDETQSEDGAHPVPPGHATSTLPLGVTLTGYRLLGLLFLVAALSKFVISLSGPPRPTATNSLDLVFGGLLAIALWCLGWYESADPPIWRPFFHIDYSRQVIATIVFLGRVIIIAALWFGQQVAIRFIITACSRSLPGVSFLLVFSFGFVVHTLVTLVVYAPSLLFIRSSLFRRASRKWPLSLVAKAMFFLGSELFDGPETALGLLLGTIMYWVDLFTHWET